MTIWGLVAICIAVVGAVTAFDIRRDARLTEAEREQE